MSLKLPEYEFGECCICKKICKSITLHNKKGNDIFFPHMPENSNAHIECYIDHCVKISIEKHLAK